MPRDSADLAGATARPIDVVLICIDTLRSDHLGCYGYRRETSPEIDRLAAEGVLFERCRSQAPWTLPSHASLFTSLYPSSCGVEFASLFRFGPSWAELLAPKHTTLAERLAAAGYRCGARVGMLWLGPGFGLDQGFEDVELREGRLTSAWLVDSAIEWLASGDGRPSFVFLHLFDVHEYAAPARFTRELGSADRVRLAGLASRVDGLFDSLSDEELDLLTRGYDAAIRYVDHEVGRLLAWLKEEGRWDRTAVVLVSDHGEELWDHGGTGHCFTLYEEQLRVPLVVKPPSFEVAIPPRRVSSPVGLIDVTPTILELAGRRVPAGLEGRSLYPLMRGGELPARPLFAEAAKVFNRCAVIQDERKLILNRLPPRRPFEPQLLLANLRSLYVAGPDELFVLESDPGERINRFGDDRAVDTMSKAVLRHLEGATGRLGAAVDEEDEARLRSLGYLD